MNRTHRTSPALLISRRLALLATCLLATFLLATFLLGCGSSEPPSTPTASPGSPASSAPAAPLQLALNWYPDNQHAGFYGAELFGHFQRAGLQVEIVPGGPAAPVIQNVAMKRMACGVANADQVLLARAQKAPVVAVMASIQTSPRCLMLHEGSGIQNWQDLKDVTLAMGAGQPFTVYLQKHLPLPNVQIVPYTGSIAPFLADQRFAQQAYSFSEPYAARQKGASPRVLMAADLGYNTYTSVLVVHEETIRDAPQQVAAIVQAIQMGWRDYLATPQTVHERIHSVNPQQEIAALDFGLEALRHLCLPADFPPEQLGTMDPARWQKLNDQLIELGLLPAGNSPQGAYSLEFAQPLPAKSGP